MGKVLDIYTPLKSEIRRPIFCDPTKTLCSFNAKVLGKYFYILFD